MFDPPLGQNIVNVACHTIASKSECHKETNIYVCGMQSTVDGSINKMTIVG